MTTSGRPWVADFRPRMRTTADCVGSGVAVGGFGVGSGVGGTSDASGPGVCSPCAAALKAAPSQIDNKIMIMPRAAASSAPRKLNVELKEVFPTLSLVQSREALYRIGGGLRLSVGLKVVSMRPVIRPHLEFPDRGRANRRPEWPLQS